MDVRNPQYISASEDRHFSPKSRISDAEERILVIGVFSTRVLVVDVDDIERTELAEAPGNMT